MELVAVMRCDDDDDDDDDVMTMGIFQEMIFPEMRRSLKGHPGARTHTTHKQRARDQRAKNTGEALRKQGNTRTRPEKNNNVQKNGRPDASLSVALNRSWAHPRYPRGCPHT